MYISLHIINLLPFAFIPSALFIPLNLNTTDVQSVNTPSSNITIPALNDPPKADCYNERSWAGITPLDNDACTELFQSLTTSSRFKHQPFRVLPTDRPWMFSLSDRACYLTLEPSSDSTADIFTMAKIREVAEKISKDCSDKRFGGSDPIGERHFRLNLTRAPTRRTQDTSVQQE